MFFSLKTCDFMEITELLINLAKKVWESKPWKILVFEINS